MNLVMMTFIFLFSLQAAPNKFPVIVKIGNANNGAGKVSFVFIFCVCVVNCVPFSLPQSVI